MTCTAVCWVPVVLSPEGDNTNRGCVPLGYPSIQIEDLAYLLLSPDEVGGQSWVQTKFLSQR